MSERTDKERWKDMRTYLRSELAMWKQERRECKRFGAQWHYAGGAISVLQDVIANVNDTLRTVKKP